MAYCRTYGLPATISRCSNNYGPYQFPEKLLPLMINNASLGKPESLITYVADRMGHDQRYAIDPSKANAELGWGPTTMFADGIKLTIQWYKDHMDWMEECTSGEYVKYYDKMYAKR